MIHRSVLSDRKHDSKNGQVQGPANDQRKPLEDLQKAWRFDTVFKKNHKKMTSWKPKKDLKTSAQHKALKQCRQVVKLMIISALPGQV